MNSLKRKREYKKDSIYVLDLYTLTFDENETLESLGDTTVSKIYNSYLFKKIIHYIERGRNTKFEFQGLQCFRPCITKDSNVTNSICVMRCTSLYLCFFLTYFYFVVFCFVFVFRVEWIYCNKTFAVNKTNKFITCAIEIVICELSCFTATWLVNLLNLFMFGLHSLSLLLTNAFGFYDIYTIQ